MMEILLPEQIESYSRLRGYRPEAHGAGPHKH